MPSQMTLINSITLESPASSITFSSIPSTYRDLRLVLTAQGNSTTTAALRFNSDSGTNYNVCQWQGTSGQRAMNLTSLGYLSIYNNNGLSTDPFGAIVWNIFNYENSIFWKTVIGEDSCIYDTYNNLTKIAGVWRNVSTITSIEISTLGSATYVAGTNASLYGIG